jgi:hypothetical protein
VTFSVIGMELCLVSLLLGWLWVVVAGGTWPVPIVALLLAWRGWVLAEGWLDRELIEAELQAGTLGVLVLVGILSWQVPGVGVLPALGFFGAGLIGLGVARRAERRGPSAQPEVDWLALVGLMLVVLLIVCAAIVLVVTPELLSTMAEQALTVAGLAARGFADLLAWISSLLPSWSPAVEPPQPATAPGATLPPPTTRLPSSIPMPPFVIFEYLLIFCGLAFMAYGIRTVLRFMPRRMLWDRSDREKEPGPPVSEAPAFSWRGWWHVFLVWFRSWISGAGHPADRAGDQRAGGSARTPQEERSIRALYREFLTAAERAGFDRTPSTTPAELARSLAVARPTSQAPVTDLTELYVRTRYGQERAGRDDISRMRSAVQRARGELTPPRPAPEPPPERRPREDL